MVWSCPEVRIHRRLFPFRAQTSLRDGAEQEVKPPNPVRNADPGLVGRDPCTRKEQNSSLNCPFQTSDSRIRGSQVSEADSVVLSEIVPEVSR